MVVKYDNSPESDEYIDDCQTSDPMYVYQVSDIGSEICGLLYQYSISDTDDFVTVKSDGYAFKKKGTIDFDGLEIYPGLVGYHMLDNEEIRVLDIENNGDTRFILAEYVDTGNKVRLLPNFFTRTRVDTLNTILDGISEEYGEDSEYASKLRRMMKLYDIIGKEI